MFRAHKLIIIERMVIYAVSSLLACLMCACAHSHVDKSRNLL